MKSLAKNKSCEDRRTGFRGGIKEAIRMVEMEQEWLVMQEKKKKTGEKPRNDCFQVQNIVSSVHCYREDK